MISGLQEDLKKEHQILQDLKMDLDMEKMTINQLKERSKDIDLMASQISSSNPKLQ